jgi:hypothetical protein
MKPITLLRIKRKLIRTFFREQWSLLVCDHKGKMLASIVPPKNCQWADPFPVEHEGKTYIFLEQQTGSGNGILGFIELYPDLTHSGFTPILEKEYHLSFPNVFVIEKEKEKIWFMIPESHENRSIDLYTAVNFPDKWEFSMTLIDNIIAADTVVFFHENKWWLFTSLDSDTARANSNLSAFYSDDFPSNRWVSHPQNPLCTDLGNSRMAGSVFIDKTTGLINRPSQNCIKDYGKETNINEIVELSTGKYRERITRTIRPEKSLHAVCTHSYNFSGSYLLRDIKTRCLRIFP